MTYPEYKKYQDSYTEFVITTNSSISELLNYNDMTRFVNTPFKGEIKNFPKDIVDVMIKRQVEQGGKADVSVFEKDKEAGFIWMDTIEGASFWNEVIINKNFILFYNKYSKYFKDETTGYSGELKGFPTEVVEKMLERQVDQGNKPKVKVFEKCISADIDGGGFSWINTIEGHDFWNSVLCLQNFDIFFEKYPKS